MELEFVRSINITEETAPKVKASAEKNRVVLTCHAPYFINLNSADRKKLEESKGRIINSARIAHLCGAWSVAFHPAFYQKETPQKTYENVKSAVEEITEILKSEGVDFIRMDIEGYEVMAFQGMQELLKSKRPLKIFIEFHHHAIPQYSKKDTLQRAEKIESFGFKSFTTDNHNYLFYK